MNPWPRLLPGMSPPPPLAMGATVEHMGSHTVRIRTLFNVHVRTTRATRNVQRADAHHRRVALRGAAGSVGAGAAEPGDSVFANAAVSGKKNPRAGPVNHPSGFGQPVLCRRVEPDTLDSHSCSQERQHRNLVQLPLHGSNRRVKLQDDAGRQPLLTVCGRDASILNPTTWRAG